MSFLTIHDLSLLVTAKRYPVEWWLCYSDTDRPHWWNRWLDPRFRHVMALRRDGRVWVAFRPHGEFLDVEVLRSDMTPWQICPGAIVQRVVVLRESGRIRSQFHVGPITCVELIKALLGIRRWWIRTPRQLFDYCRREYGQSGRTTADRAGEAAAQPPARGARPARRGREPALEGSDSQPPRCA